MLPIIPSAARLSLPKDATLGFAFPAETGSAFIEDSEATGQFR